MGLNFLGRRRPYAQTPQNPITAATTGTPLKCPGVYTIFSTVSSTGASIKNYTIAAPLPQFIGATVEVHCIKSSTNKAPRITFTNCSLYSTVSSTSITKDTIRFGRADQSVILRAFSTSKYRLVSAVNTPTVTTS